MHSDDDNLYIWKRFRLTDLKLRINVTNPIYTKPDWFPIHAGTKENTVWPSSTEEGIPKSPRPSSMGRNQISYVMTTTLHPMLRVIILPTQNRGGKGEKSIWTELKCAINAQERFHRSYGQRLQA